MNAYVICQEDRQGIRRWEFVDADSYYDAIQKSSFDAILMVFRVDQSLIEE